MKTIFLDFDGVLFDTVLESYLLSRYSFSDIEPFAPIKEIEYEMFHSVRYMITNSWHYYYIMKLISENTSSKDFALKFQNCIENRDLNSDSNFDKKFQEKRKDLINNYFQFWKNLDKPYPFFEKIKSISSDFNIIIVSTKNEEAIIRHCKDYGLNIKEENIIGKTKLKQFGSKKEFLEYYINTNKIQTSIFIDDAITTVNECSNIPKLKALCANWGYVAKKNDGLYEEEIINIIKEKLNDKSN